MVSYKYVFSYELWNVMKSQSYFTRTTEYYWALFLWSKFVVLHLGSHHISKLIRETKLVRDQILVKCLTLFSRKSILKKHFRKKKRIGVNMYQSVKETWTFYSMFTWRIQLDNEISMICSQQIWRTFSFLNCVLYWVQVSELYKTIDKHKLL